MVFKGSLFGRVFMGLVKVVLGVVVLSPFVIVNGLYSLGIGAAGFFCLETGEESWPAATQHRRFRTVGVIVTLASVVFTIYAARLFIGSETVAFPQIVVFALAAVTFTEIVLNIRSAVIHRRDPSSLVQAARLAGVAASLTALALVQSTLLAITDSTGSSPMNAWGGVLCGGLAALVGVGMIVVATSRLHHQPRPAPPSTSCRRSPEDGRDSATGHESEINLLPVSPLVSVFSA